MSDSDPATIACTACSTGFGGWDGQSPCPDTGTGEHTWLTAVPRPAEEPDREALVDVLVAHQRYDIGSCLCGWAELGLSHARHVADAVLALLPTPPAPDTTDSERFLRIVDLIAGAHDSDDLAAHVRLAFTPAPPVPAEDPEALGPIHRFLTGRHHDSPTPPAPGGGGTDLRGEVERLPEVRQLRHEAATIQETHDRDDLTEYGQGRYSGLMTGLAALDAALAARDADQGAGALAEVRAILAAPGPMGTAVRLGLISAALARATPEAEEGHRG